MPTDLLIYGLPGAAAAICAVSLAYFVRRAKNRRRDLRLAAGQSRLFGEQIDEQLALLDQYDENLLSEAEQSLDMLQVALIDRQAHLLNFEDLAMLQRYKLEIQEGSARSLVAQPRDLTSGPPAQATAPHVEPLVPPATRSDLEDQLLEKINQLNQANKKQRRPRA